MPTGTTDGTVPRLVRPSWAVSAIVERVNADLARADWDASRLRLMLSGRAFARTGSMADDATRPPDSS